MLTRLDDADDTQEDIDYGNKEYTQNYKDIGELEEEAQEEP